MNEDELMDLKAQDPVAYAVHLYNEELGSEEALPYKDITQMTREQLEDWEAQDPVGFEKNLHRQVHYESQQAKAHKRSENRMAAAERGHSSPREKMVARLGEALRQSRRRGR